MEKNIVLDGNKCWLYTNNRDLHIQDQHTQNIENWTIKPNQEIESITIIAEKGSVSVSAIRYCMQNNIQVNILDFQGRLVTTAMLPSIHRNTIYKLCQFRAYENKEKRTYIAQKLIEGKIVNKLEVLRWLEINYDENRISNYLEALSKLNDVNKLRGIEMNFGVYYWKLLRPLFSSEFQFETRRGTRYWKGDMYRAMDPINCLLNYAYTLLKGYCYYSVYSAGLDPYIGFLHRISTTTRGAKAEPLIYDMQEIFRFAIDATIIRGIQENLFTLEDFERTKGYEYRYNYNLRLKAKSTKKLVHIVRREFNRKLDYDKQRVKLSTVITLKVKELRQYLTGKQKDLDFTIPFDLREKDNQEMRELLLELDQKEAAKLYCISNNKLKDLKDQAKSDEPLRLEQRDQIVFDELLKCKKELRITTTRRKSKT